VDSEGARARGCPRQAVAALDGIAGARVDWGDFKGLNQRERKALDLFEERRNLGYGISIVKDHQATSPSTGSTLDLDIASRSVRVWKGEGNPDEVG
jgi:hypothetical protein